MRRMGSTFLLHQCLLDFLDRDGNEEWMVLLFTEGYSPQNDVFVFLDKEIRTRVVKGTEIRDGTLGALTNVSEECRHSGGVSLTNQGFRLLCFEGLLGTTNVIMIRLART